MLNMYDDEVMHGAALIRVNRREHLGTSLAIGHRSRWPFAGITASTVKTFLGCDQGALPVALYV